MKGRWVLTGAGLVSAGGDAPADLARSIAAGASLARPIPAAAWGGEDPAHPLAAAGIEQFDPKRYLQRRGLRDLSRTSQLTCAAAASLAETLAGVPPSDVGVALGSAWGSMKAVVDFEGQSTVKGGRLVDPLLFAETVANVPAGHLSVFFGWSAFNVTLSCGSSSGLEAVREAIGLLEEERALLAVAGGADELNLPILRVLQGGIPAGSEEEWSPFGASRRGPAGGEGSCLFVVEGRDSARARGVRPLAVVRAAAGAFAPSEDGEDGSLARRIASILNRALEEASLKPAAIDLFVASAAGDVAGDRAEAEAIAAVFGEGREGPPVIVPKGILGETWGAAAPLAAVAAVESMRTGRIPRAPRGYVPDPVLPRLNLPAEPLKRDVRNALVLGRSGTGHLSALVLSDTEGSDGS